MNTMEESKENSLDEKAGLIQENKVEDKTQNVGDSEISLKDSSDDINLNDGVSYTNEYIEVTEEGVNDLDKKKNYTSISETVVNKDVVLKYDDNFDQTNINEEDLALPIEADNNTQNVENCKISLKDSLDVMTHNDGNDHSNESEEAMEEACDDDNNKKNNAPISETEENTLNFTNSTSNNKVAESTFDDNYEQTSINEEDLALTTEVTAEIIDEVKKLNLGNLNNLSEIIAFNEVKQSTLLSMSKIIVADECQSVKITEDSLPAIKFNTELPERSNSDISFDPKVILKENLPLEKINDSENVSDDSLHVNFNHGLNKPDMMLEIPTQELIDVYDVDLSMNSNDCDHDDSDTEIIDTRQSTSDIEITTEIKRQTIMEKEYNIEEKYKLDKNVDNTEDSFVKKSVFNIEIHNTNKKCNNSSLNANQSDVTVSNKKAFKEDQELSDYKLDDKSRENIEYATSEQVKGRDTDSNVAVNTSEYNNGLQQDSLKFDTVSINLDNTLNNLDQNKPLEHVPNTLTHNPIEDQDQSAKNKINMSEESPQISENIEDIDIQSVEKAKPLISKDDIAKTPEKTFPDLNIKQSLHLDNSETYLQIQENELNSKEVENQNKIELTMDVKEESKNELNSMEVEEENKNQLNFMEKVEVIKNGLNSMEVEEESKNELNSMEVEEEIKNKNECVQKESNIVTSNPKLDECERTTEATLPTEKNTCDIESEAVETGIQVSTTNNIIKLTPDTSDEAPEVSDSLGLLAESSRVAVEDDEYQEEDDEEDNDSYPDDESSNQMTAEHSEDSNTHNSESDVCKEQENKSNKPAEIDDRSFQFKISAVPIELLQKKAQHDEEPTQTPNKATCESKSEAEEVQNDDEETSLQEEKEFLESKETETVKLLDKSDNEAIVDNQTNKSKDMAKDSNNTEDIQEIKKDDIEKADDEPTKAPDETADNAEDAVIVDADEVTSIDATDEVEVTSEENSSDQVVDKGEDVELSDEPILCPETPNIDANSAKPKIGLEIFSLDSDEEDNANTAMKSSSSSPKKLTALELEAARGSNKCVNYACTSGADVQYMRADAACLAQYASRGNRYALVCTRCAQLVADRTRALVDGIKNMTPLLELDMEKLAQDLVEISDSESEDEAEDQKGPKEIIGEDGAKYLESCLKDILNETWIKYDMDSRMRDAHLLLNEEIKKFEKQKNEVDQMLANCQMETDKIRNDLYLTFEPQREELPSIIICDTPNFDYSCSEEEYNNSETHKEEERSLLGKRRYSGNSGPPTPKRPAIPLGYTPLGPEAQNFKQISQEAIPLPPIPDIENKNNDDKDVSVVQLSVEAAPAGLPPPGEPQRPPLKVGMPVYAMRNSFGTWLKGWILESVPKTSTSQFTVCKVKFDHNVKNPCKLLPARCIAYSEPSEVRMTIGTRVISLFKNPANGNNKRESYYSGIVAEVPNPVNSYRYLVFFDDGYAQYASHSQTRLVCESSVPVWDEVHPFSREFVRDYLITYPERPMVRLHAGQRLKTEWNGKWWSSRVLSVDASLVKVHFEEDNRTEWIYRGSTRLAPLYLELQAAVRHRTRPLPRSKAQARSNMPYVEYTRSEEQATSKETERQTQLQQQEEIRRQRAVAKKSTGVSVPSVQPHVQSNVDAVTSRVVYYTPKNAVKPYKMVPHMCSPKCKRADVLALKDLRTYNPLAKPLLSGWERQIVRYKGLKEVTYRAPCGRRVRDMQELHRYLRIIRSDMPVDLFDFHPATHCLAEFVLNKCIVGKKDLSHGKENVPVPCVNYYDDTLPEFCTYNTERTPTAGVPLNLDPAFLCGCDCTDDCQDKTKCSCWKMTLEGARTIGLNDPNVGYVYRRLPEPLPSGIYECNSRCKCKQTCLNRVAQQPLQLKLQVFKTLNRGWGIRALNDVPKGSFLCVYAGNLLTDATANLDGLNEGDEYLAELDYIEVVEQMKEGYEEDIPEADKKLDQKEISNDNTNDEDSSSSEEENIGKDDDEEDVDFRPGYIGLGDLQFNKRLRERGKGKKNIKRYANEKEKEKNSQKDGNAEDDCITISDDEEVREPSRFTAQAGMGANEFVSKYRSVRSYFGKDEACYIMDAKVQGNIGRYLNHSCSPNVFVQNVFVDTHDPRFPWVAFFALSHIRAGTELTWNYNYDIGSVPEKVLYCFCGAPNCRGRLL